MTHHHDPGPPRPIETAPGKRASAREFADSYLVELCVTVYQHVEARSPELAARRAIASLEPRHGRGRVAVVKVNPA